MFNLIFQYKELVDALDISGQSPTHVPQSPDSSNTQKLAKAQVSNHVYVNNRIPNTS